MLGTLLRGCATGLTATIVALILEHYYGCPYMPVAWGCSLVGVVGGIFHSGIPWDDLRKEH